MDSNVVRSLNFPIPIEYHPEPFTRNIEGNELRIEVSLYSEQGVFNIDIGGMRNVFNKEMNEIVREEIGSPCYDHSSSICGNGKYIDVSLTVFVKIPLK